VARGNQKKKKKVPGFSRTLPAIFTKKGTADTLKVTRTNPRKEKGLQENIFIAGSL